MSFILASTGIGSLKDLDFGQNASSPTQLAVEVQLDTVPGFALTRDGEHVRHNQLLKAQQTYSTVLFKRPYSTDIDDLASQMPIETASEDTSFDYAKSPKRQKLANGQYAGQHVMKSLVPQEERDFRGGLQDHSYVHWDSHYLQVFDHL